MPPNGVILANLEVDEAVVTPATDDTANNNTNNNSTTILYGQTDYDDSWEKNPYKACPQSKYQEYELRVDHQHGDRAQELRLFSCRRPHMRGLHIAWISFFLAFMVWFAVAPLLGEIQSDLGLTKQEIWSSSIASDATTIVMRMIIGPGTFRKMISLC